MHKPHEFERVEIGEAITRFNSLESLGLSYFSVGLVFPFAKKIHSLFSNKRWEELYITNSWYDKDPVVKSANSHSDSPVIWSTVSIDTKAGAQIMRDRFDIIGTKNGVSYCIKGRIGSFIIAVSSSQDTCPISDTFSISYPYVKDLCLSFEELIRK